MTEKEIFEHLFKVSSHSKDPRGIVSACIVNNGRIVISRASSDNGIYHAEDMLFREIEKNKLKISKETILYTTLEPCTKRTKVGMIDCTSQIIISGIKKVIFGAQDPDHSLIIKQRLNEAGIEINQTSDTLTIQKCAEIFNNSVDKKFANIDVKLKPFN